MGLSLGENEFILLKNWLSENRWRFYLRLQRLQLSQLGGLVFECYISCSVSVISFTHKVCNRPPFFYNSTKQLRWYPIWYFTVDVNRKIKANTFQISPTITQYQELAVGLKQIKEREEYFGWIKIKVYSLHIYTCLRQHRNSPPPESQWEPLKKYYFIFKKIGYYPANRDL